MVNIDLDKLLRLLGIANYQVAQMEEELQAFSRRYNDILMDNEILNKALKTQENNILMEEER